jgi:myo-inositol 2-dehydrogenase/D-chiro-inositol 1-dehydrogenase
MNRFGLIGYGAWGRFHARAIAAAQGARLAAIACRTEASADAARAEFPDARVTTRWQDIVDDPSIDAVDIVLPNYLHADVACAALGQGKDVLLEKPLATTRADCDRLVLASQTSVGVLSIGHEFRLSTQWGRAKRLIDEGAIGDPLWVNVNLFRNPYRLGADGWRHDTARVGSWILEEAVHFFDFALWYLERYGDPQTIRTHGRSRSVRASGMVDVCSSTLTFAGGAYATINQCVAGFEHHLVVEVAGSDGAIRTSWSGAMDRDDRPVFDFRVQPKGFAFKRGVHEAEHHAIPASGEVFELAEQVRLTVLAFAHRRPLVSAEESRKRVICCLAAEESMREGREVTVDFLMKP